MLCHKTIFFYLPILQKVDNRVRKMIDRENHNVIKIQKAQQRLEH